MHLFAQHLEVVEQALQQQTKHARQLIAGILDELGYPMGNVADALWDDQAKLGQQAPDLVRLRRSGLDKALACPVQG